MFIGTSGSPREECAYLIQVGGPEVDTYISYFESNWCDVIL